MATFSCSSCQTLSSFAIHTHTHTHTHTLTHGDLELLLMPDHIFLGLDLLWAPQTLEQLPLLRALYIYILYVCTYVEPYIYIYIICMYICINIHVCMYVCMYVCMHVYMYVRIYVCIIRMYVYTYVSYVCMYVCMCVCVCVYICIYIWAPHNLEQLPLSQALQCDIKVMFVSVKQ